MKFDVIHLRVFNSLCFTVNLNPGDKFAPKSIAAIMMGYSLVQKGYVLLNFQSLVIFVNRDIKFKEHIFSF